MTMSIPFIQSLRPNGRKRAVAHNTTPETEAMANALIEQGAYFDIEELMSGIISMTCEREDADGEIIVLAAEQCQNTLEVDATVRRLVDRATKHLAEWSAQHP